MNNLLLPTRNALSALRVSAVENVAVHAELHVGHTFGPSLSGFCLRKGVGARGAAR
jgi:hypothetical protein